MIIAGIDEAGRGCVIGPMVLGAVVASSQQEQQLQQLGVRDSKKLSPKRRRQLAAKIREIVHGFVIRPVAATVIDSYCRNTSLNVLEMEVMAALINELRPDVAYLDALGRYPHKSAQKVATMVDVDVDIISEIRADARYPVVAAASIIAKVARDQYISDLKQQWGDFGSGYPSDRKTINFLRETHRQYKKFPDCVRHSWMTVKKIIVQTY